MKTLTLYQPWATLVAIGAKRIETRSWKTDYRGPLAIHAGMNPKFIRMNSRDFICDQEPFYSVLTAYTYETIQQFGMDYNFMPRGFVIATCKLVACEKIGDRSDFLGYQKGYHFWENSKQERAFGDYTPGRWAWFLADIHKLPEPIPAKGNLGLWEFEF